MFNNTQKRILGALFMLCLVVVFMAAPFSSPAQADPVSIIISVIVAATATFVVDYFTCNFNVVFYGCDNGAPGGGNGGGNNGGPTPIVGGNNPGNNNNGNNNGNGNPAPQACTSAGENACHMHGNGFIVNGVCNAAVPPNSQCPAPVIGNGFYADPTLVRSGNSTKLYWDVTNATTCDLTGGDLAGQVGLAVQNLLGKSTNAITAKTVFTLSCQNGAGGPTASKQTTVNLVPSYQEI